MGGGGIIIIKPNSIEVRKLLSTEDQIALNTIASRSQVRCGILDAFKFCRILFGILRE